MGSLIYDFEADKILSAPELLAVMGVPLQAFNVGEMPTKDFRGLIGEAMFLPSICLVEAAYWLNPRGSWWGDNAKRARISRETPSVSSG